MELNHFAAVGEVAAHGTSEPDLHVFIWVAKVSVAKASKEEDSQDSMRNSVDEKESCLCSFSFSLLLIFLIGAASTGRFRFSSPRASRLPKPRGLADPAAAAAPLRGGSKMRSSELPPPPPLPPSPFPPPPGSAWRSWFSSLETMGVLRMGARRFAFLCTRRASWKGQAKEKPW